MSTCVTSISDSYHTSVFLFLFNNNNTINTITQLPTINNHP